MNISHIEHVGIAVPSLDEAIPFYEKILGLKCFAIEEVADQKVRTAFFQVGQTKIELLEGTSEDSAISKYIAKNGGRGGINTSHLQWKTAWLTHWPKLKKKVALLSTKLPAKVLKVLTSHSFTQNQLVAH